MLTPLAACYLFGRSEPAVRRAAREGLVVTHLALSFTSKQVRLFDLQSCLDYWGKNPWPKYRRPLEEELEEMRFFGGITLRYMDRDYRVLHPSPLVYQGYQVNLAKDQELT